MKLNTKDMTENELAWFIFGMCVKSVKDIYPDYSAEEINILANYQMKEVLKNF